MEQLTRHFGKVILERYDNKLEINEIEAIINYYLSFNGIYDNVIVLPEEYINEFKIYLKNILEKDKIIKTARDEGIFICMK
ncbi:hypothetical protein [Treponema sp. R80B11-R83G3]